MPVDTERAYCQCGASAHLTSTSADLVQGVLRMFWGVHASDGHGPTTRYVAARARRRETRQQAERRAPYERCWDRGHAMAGTFGYPPFEELTPGCAHFAVATCGRPECTALANDECREVTGHDGVYRPFRREAVRDAG